MAIFRNRYSPEDLTLIFVSCSFPVHVWAIPNMFRDIPSWVLHLKITDLLGAVAYSLSFMLVETLMIFFVILIIGMAIPKRLLKGSLVPFSFVLLVELSIAAIVFQYLTLKDIRYSRYYLLLGLLLILTTALITTRNQKVKRITHTIVNQLTPLAFLYIVVDIIAVIFVFIRNVGV